MSTLLSAASNVDAQFAADVRGGLTGAGQKWIPSTYLYDAVGSALFDVITLLPEYGLTRADTRVIARCARELPALVPGLCSIAELGSGTGKKTRRVLEAFGPVDYYPIDVSRSALAQCEKELAGAARVHPIEDSYIAGLRRVARRRPRKGAMLVLFLGSTIGNFGRVEAVRFLHEVRELLRPGDALLVGADLIKPEKTMLLAYDDPAGVTAAFNLNLLARVNRELGGDFDLRAFRHEARWNAVESAIEMHLVSVCDQTVEIAATRSRVTFRTRETIWTESSHKYEAASLDTMAKQAGFTPVRDWVDEEWPFAECLWIS
jgi:dimethylhistidine N-methyltransferase